MGTAKAAAEGMKLKNRERPERAFLQRCQLNKDLKEVRGETWIYGRRTLEAEGTASVKTLR